MTTTPPLTRAETTILDGIRHVRHHNRACSIAELTRSTGWSRTYVVNLCESLKAKGLIGWVDGLGGSIHPTDTIEIKAAQVGIQFEHVLDLWDALGLDLEQWKAWRAEYTPEPADAWHHLWLALHGDVESLQQALPPAPRCLIDWTRNRLGQTAEAVPVVDIELPSAEIPPPAVKRSAGPSKD